jgi:hypothetical protein
MSFDWQNLAALTAVFAAAFYVARRAWRQFVSRRSTSGCGACPSCPNENAAPRELVPLTLGKKV